MPPEAERRAELTEQLLPSYAAEYVPPQLKKFPEELPPVQAPAARELAWLAFWDILVFFGVLLVGFAYLWKRGDLAWVRSTLAEQTGPTGDKTALPPHPAEELVGAGTAS